MHLSELNNMLSDVAKAADLCIKPWRHSVLVLSDYEKDLPLNDIILLIECRTSEGIRRPENDIELEIYKSGQDISIVLSWKNLLDIPMLWQGKYSFWMDSNTGKKCEHPENHSQLEALARRLRAYFSAEDLLN